MNIFSLLKPIIQAVLGGQSNDAQDANMPAGPTTQSPTMSLLKVERKSQSQDGVFGDLTVNGTPVGVTVENLEKLIPEGLYNAVIDQSPRLGYQCPHLQVPLRDEEAGGDAGIRVHIANSPCQVDGCVAVGTNLDGDAVDNSKVDFQRMMLLLPPPGVPFKVLVQSRH